MAAMYAPTALDPARWAPGDGFQLQPDAAPYRILRRQRFDFLSSRETLIFEGCRALYRPPDSPDWAWDGALRVWVQVSFGAPDALLRRGAACLGDIAPPAAAAGDPRKFGALNILPEILDRRSEADFEVLVLDLRGGRSLPEILDEGWRSVGVPSPFEPAGAIEILRRLIELNALATQAGCCLATLHPDQVMVDENLNLRIRGLPWIVPVDAAGRFPAPWTAALAARAETDLVQAPADHASPPDGRLCLRWLAAFVQYLVTGRWVRAHQPLAAWCSALYQPDSRRLPEPWEVSLLARLWTATEPNFSRIADDLHTAVTGPRVALLATHARTFCLSATSVLDAKLQDNNWADVLRLASLGSQPLPQLYRAAEQVAIPSHRGAATASETFAGSAEYAELNALLDRIARLETAVDRATRLARQTPTSDLPRSTGMLPATAEPGLRPARYASVAPLPPPTAPKPRTGTVNAYGVPLVAKPAPLSAPSALAGPRWLSPLQALAQDLQSLLPAPAFQARLAAWLPAVQEHFSVAWVDPPLAAAQQACLTAHGPQLLAGLPALLQNHRQALAQELAAATAAVAANGARELPRFDRALRAQLRLAAFESSLPPTAPPPEAPSSTESTAPATGGLAQTEASVATLEQTGKIDPALLAQMISLATNDHPAARAGPRIGALCRLQTGLAAAQAVLAGQADLSALGGLRAALDDWPQFPVLQERWRQTLDASVLPAVVAVERAVAAPPHWPEGLLDAASLQGLVELLQGDPAATARWLGDWQPRIHAALTQLFALLTARGGPLWPRLQRCAALTAAFARFNPPAAAAWREHLELTRQRRIDLRTALTAGRAQVAWGKALALWQSGETTLADDLPPTDSGAPDVSREVSGNGEDLGARALTLWLEQASQAIEQLPPPREPAPLAALLDRLLAPLHQVRGLQAAADQPVSVAIRDVDETLRAIEDELYDRMAAQVERPEHFAVWQAAWQRLPFTPLSLRWRQLSTPPQQHLWADWLAARALLADHLLEPAAAALAGPADLHAPESAVHGPRHFAAVAPEPVIAAVLARWADGWDRQQAAAARAQARQDLDGALAVLEAGLARLRAWNIPAAVQMAAAQQELQQRQRQRDAARLAFDHRRQAILQLLAAGRLATALEEVRQLEPIFAAADWPAERLAAGRWEITAAARTRLQDQLRQAEADLSPAPDRALAALQAAAAGLEADRLGIWPATGSDPDAGRDPTDETSKHTRTALTTRLSTLFERFRAARAHERYGGALLAGLTTGALPPDAPFWAALLQPQSPAASELAALRDLPVGALGPEEWLHWLTATAPVFQGREPTDLSDLRRRVAARWAELQVELQRLRTLMAAAGPAEQARELRGFIARWRNGRQVADCRTELATLEAAAQTTFDRALTPPAGGWWLRPFRHWNVLRQAREAAEVIGATTEQLAAERLARRRCLSRIGLGLALTALAAGLFWHWV